MKKARGLVFFAIVLILLIFSSEIYANGMNKTLSFAGLGITFDYTHSKEVDDLGSYISFRGGFAHIVSFFVCADLGYRFFYRSINARLGVEALILFFGLETGIIMAYQFEEENSLFYERNEKGKFAPGIYVGLAGVLPERKFGIFLSIGGNFYFINHEHEFYISASILVNFAKN